jgi:hypothetical protein
MYIGPSPRHAVIAGRRARTTCSAPGSVPTLGTKPVLMINENPQTDGGGHWLVV